MILPVMYEEKSGIVDEGVMVDMVPRNIPIKGLLYPAAKIVNKRACSYLKLDPSQFCFFFIKMKKENGVPYA